MPAEFRRVSVSIVARTYDNPPVVGVCISYDINNPAQEHEMRKAYMNWGAHLPDFDVRVMENKKSVACDPVVNKGQFSGASAKEYRFQAW